MSKIALLLLGKKGYKILRDIAEGDGLNLLTDVVAARDPGIDYDYYNEICDLCAEKGIRFHDRLDQAFKIDDFDGYLLAIGWRWMLPSGNKILVIHDSILPRYRGFSPLVSSLINREKIIGATALFADNEYDKGRVVVQSEKSIDYPITISEAIDLMCDIYIEIARKLVRSINEGEELRGVDQDESQASYSLWRDVEDYWIDWKWDSGKIKRFIDAVGSPYAGARTYCNEVTAIIYGAQLVDDVAVNDRLSAIGKVIFIDDGYPVVVCGKGLIKITGIKSNDGESLVPLNKFRTRFVGKKS